MKKLSLLLLFGLLVGLWGCNEELLIEPEQRGSINGQVLTKKDGQPVSKAAVRLSPSGRTVQTDTLGRFRFDSVLVGKYTLQATKERFGEQLTTVEVMSNYSTSTVLHLTNDNPPPTEPQLLFPTTGSASVPTTPVLKWQATDPGKDPLTYEVVITRQGSTTPTQTVTGLTADSLRLEGLDYNTAYYWQVTVSDGTHAVSGKTWSFRTMPFPEVAYVFARRVGGSYQIFAAPDQGNPLQLTHEGSNWRPVVSPNGKKIAFISNAKTELHLFVMNLDGSDPYQATTIPVGGLIPTDLSFCWSPDGSQLLYPSNNKLYAVRADGSGIGLRQVAQTFLGRQFAGCDWTPQGDRIIARTTGPSVYENQFTLMTSQGQEATLVHFRNGSRMGNPVFSITGKEVLFSYDTARYQNDGGRQLYAQIAVLTLATKGVKDVLGGGTGTQSGKLDGTNDLNPRYSPDGAKIIFTNASNTGTGPSTVWTMDLNGQNRTVLMKAAEMPDWPTPLKK